MSQIGPHLDARALGEKLQELSPKGSAEGGILWSVALEVFPREITSPPPTDLVTTIRMRIPGTPPGGESTIRAPRRLAEKRFGDYLLFTAYNGLLSAKQGLQPSSCFFTLSHCDNAIVAAAGSGAGLKGVGVDLEPLSRRVAAPVIERISTEEERKLGLDTLTMWLVKEACFKANPRNLKTVVSQYYVREFDKARGTGKAVFGNAATGNEETMHFFCTNVSLPGAEPKWRVAVAWCV